MSFTSSQASFFRNSRKVFFKRFELVQCMHKNNTISPAEDRVSPQKNHGIFLFTTLFTFLLLDTETLPKIVAFGSCLQPRLPWRWLYDTSFWHTYVKSMSGGPSSQLLCSFVTDYLPVNCTLHENLHSSTFKSKPLVFPIVWSSFLAVLSFLDVCCASR